MINRSYDNYRNPYKGTFLIDFIKIQDLPIDHNDLINSPYLEFEGKYNRLTGEIYEFPLSAEYNKITFSINDNAKYRVDNPSIPYKIHCNVSGSIHKYFDANDSNASDFTYRQLIDSIIEICSKFRLNPFKCVLTNVEFGVNIIPPIPSDKALRNLINHWGHEFTHVGGKAKGKECCKQQYWIKIYDKNWKRKSGHELLRIEIHVAKMNYLTEIGIRTLADLLSLDKIMQLGAKLEAIWNGIRYFDDTLLFDKMNDKERSFMNQWRNPIYWQELKEIKYTTYKYHGKRFKEITEKYSRDHRQKQIGSLIKKKCAELLICDQETLSKLTIFLDQYSKAKTIQITTPSIELIIPETHTTLSPNNGQEKRRCKTCGKDISNQKEDSFFCSAKYVGEERAKQCRNADSNPRNYIKRKINRIHMYPVLFDPNRYLVLNEDQKKLLA